MANRYLSIYLNDHLAGSVAGVELARRASSANRGTALGAVLERVCAEIEADRRTLVQLMDRLGARRSAVKTARAGEKLGRLKLNGKVRGNSPLSRMVELELLEIGIAGKQKLWTALGRALGSSFEEFDFEDLAARADAQRSELENYRLKVAVEAMAGETVAASEHSIR